MRILSHRDILAFRSAFLSGVPSLDDLKRFIERFGERQRKRGPSKLGRRLRRKAELGRAGAF